MGMDTAINAITWGGGDINLELYSSSVFDGIQFARDMSRKQGYGYDSIRIQFSLEAEPKRQFK